MRKRGAAEAANGSRANVHEVKRPRAQPEGLPEWANPRSQPDGTGFLRWDIYEGTERSIPVSVHREVDEPAPLPAAPAAFPPPPVVAPPSIHGAHTAGDFAAPPLPPQLPPPLPAPSALPLTLWAPAAPAVRLPEPLQQLTGQRWNHFVPALLWKSLAYAEDRTRMYA